MIASSFLLTPTRSRSLRATPYSHDGKRCKRCGSACRIAPQRACKWRANYLKPKEIPTTPAHFALAMRHELFEAQNDRFTIGATPGRRDIP
jgi:hypothetical protein